MKQSSPTPKEFEQFYASLTELYPVEDKWHRATHRWVDRTVRSLFRKVGPLSRRSVLNLGSGGVSFGIPEDAILHVDIHRGSFAPHQQVVEADIQNLPLLGGGFDYCICVGSVLNHCDDALAVIQGIGRELRVTGQLVLEFESSGSLEFASGDAFRKATALVETLYQGKPMKIWVYSEDYLRGLLEVEGFAIERVRRGHIASIIAYRVLKDADKAARWSRLDWLLRPLAPLARTAHNVILVCRKCR